MSYTAVPSAPAENININGDNQYHPPEISATVISVQPAAFQGIPVRAPWRIFDKEHEFHFALDPSLDEGVPVGRWRDGLCDCGNACFPAFLGTLCCGGWITSAPLLDRLGLVPRSIMLWYGIGSIFAYFFLPPAQAIFFLAAVATAFGVRQEVRRRYRIPGDTFGDALRAIFCAPCSIAQAARHVFPYTSSCDTSNIWDPHAGRRGGMGSEQGPNTARMV